jgi:hypothetical protein
LLFHGNNDLWTRLNVMLNVHCLSCYIQELIHPQRLRSRFLFIWHSWLLLIRGVNLWHSKPYDAMSKPSCIIEHFLLNEEKVNSITGNTLGESAKLRKATISFVKSVCSSFHWSVCLSVRMKQLGPHRKDFCETWYLICFRKSVESVRLLLKSDKNIGYFTWTHTYIYDNIFLDHL